MPQTGTQTQVKVQPQALTPTYNETIVVLESPNIQSTNFKWLVDIYKGVVGDPDYALLSTIVILPNPDGYGVIDFHRHIENYITTSFFPADITNLSERVFDDGLKWSYQATEQFSKPVWRFEDNFTSSGTFVGWTSSVDKHPYIVGDFINITQDPGFTHASYEGLATVTVIIDEYTVLTDKIYAGVTPPEAGLSELSSSISTFIPDTEVRFIEQTLTLAQTTNYSFNGVFTFQDYRNYLSTDYTLTSTSPVTTKFLLAGPREFNVSLSDRVWINSVIGTPKWDGHIIASNNGTYAVSQSYSASGQHFINQNKVGPKDFLETLDTPIALTGSLPVVDANTTYITVTPVANGGTPVGETVTLNIVDDCSKYEAIRFFYLDKLGSYLPVTFNKVNRTNISNTRSNYRQNYGSYDSVANAWGYTTYARGTTTYDLNSKEIVTCTSDWMDEVGVSMVVDMLNSPSVYIQDDNGEYIAITITTNTYEVKKTVNDKLLNYTLTFEYAQMNGNQRG
tara:strand:+ start:471 stop:1994 length:1524 start_codon:yes stop_codon:yes gene_type:complete